MTKLLMKAFVAASCLSEDLQDLLAQELLDNLNMEWLWDKTLADSQAMLDRMANQAEQDFNTGKTKEMGFDEL